MARRSRISQGGVLAELSSRVTSPSNRRNGGNTIRVGAGGVSRNSHQMAGRANRPSNAQGAANANAPMLNILAISSR